MANLLVLGSNSDIAVAFIEVYLKIKEPEELYLASSNVAEAEKWAQHFQAKYSVKAKVIPMDLLKEQDLTWIDKTDFETVFCATGYLGEDTATGLYDAENSQRIIDINYAKLVPVLNVLAEKLEKKRSGDLVLLSSVAGERGRQSNFIYGSAKAGFTAYASGLRNYLSKKGVHVLTVKPGFMETKMTAHLDLPKPLTASPQEAAKKIYKAYEGRENVLYVLPIWRLIMLVIKSIPEFVFKRLSL